VDFLLEFAAELLAVSFAGNVHWQGNSSNSAHWFPAVLKILRKYLPTKLLPSHLNPLQNPQEIGFLRKFSKIRWKFHRKCANLVIGAHMLNNGDK